MGLRNALSSLSTAERWGYFVWGIGVAVILVPELTAAAGAEDLWPTISSTVGHLEYEHSWVASTLPDPSIGRRPRRAQAPRPRQDFAMQPVRRTRKGRLGFWPALALSATMAAGVAIGLAVAPVRTQVVRTAGATGAGGTGRQSPRRSGPRASPAPAAGGGVTVSVVGNHLVGRGGKQLRLLGVDRAGSEYACIQGWGIFDGPSGAASVAAIAAWHVDAVRVPLNEDCWLGINGVPSKYGGTAYRAAIAAYVGRLQAAGLVVVLDLHWNAPGTAPATGQQVMADADHSPAFWRSVATYFKGNHGLVFDLYNEPNTISWSCWLDGCTAPAGWKVAGMQTLVDAVRSTGATQPLMVGGLAWSNDLSQWLKHEPKDPLHQLVASAHVYNFNSCNAAICWTATLGKVAKVVPVVTGEIGENDCRHGFVDRYMAWADQEGISYLGWTWDAGGGWTCTGGPSLITSYTGTPTEFGAGLRSHLAALAKGT